VVQYHKRLREGIEEVEAGRLRLVPLPPQHLSTRLLELSFTEVMAKHQLITQPSFMALLEEQYRASSVGAADSPARWALVNAVLGLAHWFKTSPTAGRNMFEYPRAFYRNATAVLSELILKTPSLLSIQALLAMAMFAETSSDTASFVMLTTNASRQLELLGCVTTHEQTTRNREVEEAAEEGLRSAYKVALELEVLAAQRYGMRLLLTAT
jgi:hypothetical protein